MYKDYEDRVKTLQRQAAEQLQKDIAEADRQTSDNLQSLRTELLLSLINIRAARKLTQTKLAEQVGTSQSVIARIESGKGNPSLGMLLRVARALGVNLLFYK